MAYKFQFGPSVMSGTLEQEGTLDITDAGVLKLAGVQLSDANRNLTAVSLSGSSVLNVVGRAELKNELHVSGAAVFKLGASMGDANVTNVGDIALDSISADGTSFSFGSNWTAAGRTCADLGTVTTADINGGSVDGATIGAAAQSSGRFTSLSASGDLSIADNAVINGTAGVFGLLTAHAGASMGDANITNVGDIALDSISADGSSFSFGSNWTAAGRTCADLGTVTTADINGGSVDGAAIGAAAQSTGQFTTLSASSTLDVVGISRYHGLATYAAGVASTTLSASSTLDVVGNVTSHGTVKLAGVAAAAAAVANDDLYFLDSDGLMKKESFADYATAIAGDGLAASAGVLSVSLTELTEAAVNVAADSLIFIDADGTVTRRDTFVDYAAALVASEPGFASTGGKLQFDPNSLQAASIASGDSMILIDADGSNIPKKETIDDIATLFAGVGLSAASAVLALDLNELTAAVVNVGADSIAIIDADDSNNSKKESIADLVSAMAGGGLSASNGVLSTQAGAVAIVGDANATLAEGMNAGNVNFTADRTWTLPAAPSEGDVVQVKAPGSLGGNELIILKGSAAHRIDGAEQIEVESNGGAVSMMYVGSNSWVIF